jgi:hypothetical protein
VRSVGKIPRLSAADLEPIVEKCEQLYRRLNPKERSGLLREINEAIANYEFRCGQARAPGQFRKRVEDMRSALRRLQMKLPTDRHDDLFEFTVKLGDAYAAKHGAHPGITPVRMEDLSSMGIEDEFRYDSARRFQELKEAVDQVLSWTSGYQAEPIPRGGWVDLERIYGPTRGPLVSLTGKDLPGIFEKYIGQIEAGRQTNPPWVKFVSEVCKKVRIISRSNGLTPSAIRKNRKRLKSTPDPFELEEPIGPLWED